MFFVLTQHAISADVSCTSGLDRDLDVDGASGSIQVVSLVAKISAESPSTAYLITIYEIVARRPMQFLAALKCRSFDRGSAS